MIVGAPAAWHLVAEKLGGTLAFDEADWRARLEVTLAGVAVVARSVLTTSQTSAIGMRVSAPAPGAEQVELDVHHGYVYPIGRALGIQDVLVGDAAFDDRFIVKCNDDELARARLDAEARAAIIATSDSYAFALRDAEVWVSRRGAMIEDDPAALEAVLRATALLASSGQRLLARWQEAARQLGGRLTSASGRFGFDGDPLLELMHPNSRIAIDAAFAGLGGHGPAGLWTRARARRTAAVQDRWAVHARDHRLRLHPRLEEGEPVSDDAFADRWRCLADDPARLAARLSPARRVLLRDLAPAAVLGEAGEVVAWLPGFVHDPARLSRLADLVAELAIEIEIAGSGPYR